MRFTAIGILLTAILVVSCSPKEEKSSPPVDSEEGSEKVSTELNEFGELSKQIVGDAQAVLAGNLMKALSKAGSEYALEFCNINAIRLTDSVSLAKGVTIRRISDKPRNSANKASEAELRFFEDTKNAMVKGVIPEGHISEDVGKISAYHPIITNTLCLQCHGKKNVDIKEPTLLKIQKLYPRDLATGYSSNELRGFWVVEKNK